MLFKCLRLTLIFTLFFSANVFSSEEKTKEKPNYALGLNAGWVVGNGILFRMYNNKQFYQATFVGLIDKDSEEEYLNFSLSYARYLNKFDYSTPIGLKWVTGGEIVYDQSDNINNNEINIGSGIGIDVGKIFNDGILISLDLIYTATFKGISALEFNALTLKPSLGIAYNF